MKCRFYVEDTNNGTTGVYDTFDEAFEHAKFDLAEYRKEAGQDGEWSLDAGDLCVYEAPEDAEDAREYTLRAKNVEFDLQPIPDDVDARGAEYSCDMRMVRIAQAEAQS